MRSLQFLILMLLATAARADYYYYKCSSGLVDCSAENFVGEYYGDYGLTHLQPVEWPNEPTYYALGIGILFSNSHGQAVGYADPCCAGGSLVLVFGENGVVHCVLLECRDEDERIMGISESGIIAANSPDFSGGFLSDFQGHLLLVGDTTSQLLHSPSGDVLLSQFLIEGMNAKNGQLLVNAIAEDADSRNIVGSGEAVLSPFAVPEPSTFLMVATAAGIALLVLRSRRMT